MIDWRFILRKYVFQRSRFQYEPEVKKALRKLHGKIFVDVGANTGRYSRALAKNFTWVYAFEPNPKVLPALKFNTRFRRNIVVVPVALSDSTGTATLYDSGLDPLTGAASTILPKFEYFPASQPKGQVFEGRHGCVVETVRFDEYFPGADLVKIDVEGAEFQVLAGMGDAISRVKNICVELHNRHSKLGLEQGLRAHGFSLRWLDSDHVLATRDKAMKIAVYTISRKPTPWPGDIRFGGVSTAYTAYYNLAEDTEAPEVERYYTAYKNQDWYSSLKYITYLADKRNRAVASRAVSRDDTHHVLR
jgi:FkbM family methyltransferase